MFPWKKGKNIFNKKLKNQHGSPKSAEPIVNEVMESIATNEDNPASQEPISNATDEDDQ